MTPSQELQYLLAVKAGQPMTPEEQALMDQIDVINKKIEDSFVLIIAYQQGQITQDEYDAVIAQRSIWDTERSAVQAQLVALLKEGVQQ